MKRLPNWKQLSSKMKSKQRKNAVTTLLVFGKEEEGEKEKINGQNNSKRQL
jgi:hypothetical protein